MILVHARNVNEAYWQGAVLLKNVGEIEETRNGPAIVAPYPMTTHYDRPQERVLFSPSRDANPFFHLFECLWILSGRRDVAWIAQFNQRIAQYSDGGETFHGAYGDRLRHWARNSQPNYRGLDQIDLAVHMLRKDPSTRRCVVALYDPACDLGTMSLDIPCNDTIKFEIRRMKLNMMVFCRSNDLIWGAYGANAVHFSFLQEVVASLVGVEVGWYEQISCNMHAYLDVWEAKQPWFSHHHEDEHLLYQQGATTWYPIVSNIDFWWYDLNQFMSWTEYWASGTTSQPPHYRNTWFLDVATPMYIAWRARKDARHSDAYSALGHVKALDWRRAGVEWMMRRDRASAEHATMVIGG